MSPIELSTQTKFYQHYTITEPYKRFRLRLPSNFNPLIA